MPTNAEIRAFLLDRLNPRQINVVTAAERRTLVIAGAGSGKTDVMARRIAWWVSLGTVEKNRIVAFTFTERAAEEMKFRIRAFVQGVTAEGADATLGGMYVGTIHSFCLKTLRELAPDRYHNFDIIDESARHALIQRGYYGILGLTGLQAAAGLGMAATMELFGHAYDLLNEYNQLDVELAPGDPPHRLEDEAEWCKRAQLRTNVGRDAIATSFAQAAARFYAYLRCRRFFDFSTSQSELVRLLDENVAALDGIRAARTHIVVDEVQDINPVQAALIERLVGPNGVLTAVGDHRQAIYRFRGSRVEIMGELAAQFVPPEGNVYDLTHNYRSTPRIVHIANVWADTIGPVGGMMTPHMEHGRVRRVDNDSTHVATLTFEDREDEAAWIAQTICALVRRGPHEGAYNDTRQSDRGLTYSDLAVLVRSSTDARVYMNALHAAGIPSVVRAGPDLFAQPEVLLFLGALGRAVGLAEFLGAGWGPSLPARITNVLGCAPVPEDVIRTSCQVLADAGLSLGDGAADRILHAAELVHRRMQGDEVAAAERARVATIPLRAWLGRRGRPRRVFPQALYHWLLAEAGVERWDGREAGAESAMFHLGQLSNLVKGLETPGWSDPDDFRFQVIALYLWGAKNAKTDEAPLLVPPDAVTIGTIHGAKGLEFAAVFLADVCARRFPSNRARTPPQLPFSGRFRRVIDPATLADNDNLDDERRLMYVALTRAERYLFVTCSGRQRSVFFREVSRLVGELGGVVNGHPMSIPSNLVYRPSEQSRERIRLITSFSDVRYFLECPHDFYLRKVLGFAPTIDQAFGYGRGVHNLMRAIHSDPKRWAGLAQDPEALQGEIRRLIESGLFYLRYTTGDPRANMEAKAVRIVSDYVIRYATELETLTFEPEREFETLLPDEEVLVSGAIDVIRLDDPPRVSVIDFKSGHAESDVAEKLDEAEMKLQVSLYGLAAKTELEYEPDRGVVRYLGEDDPSRSEMDVPLDAEALAAARAVLSETAAQIRARRFSSGPSRAPRDPTKRTRCAECDFHEFCGMEAAVRFRTDRGPGA